MRNPFDFLREKPATLWADDRPGVLDRIRAAADRGADVSSTVEFPQGGEIRFIAGMLDAVAGGNDEGHGAELATFLAGLGPQPTDDALKTAYVKMVATGAAPGTVDAMLEAIRTDTPVPQASVAAFARRLLREAPDVDPVKLAISLIGACGDASDFADLKMAALHDELALFCIVALSNLGSPQETIWEVAKTVHGWGRIQAVRRLTGVDDRIRSWMLREGFRNIIMNEYLAYHCAVEGGLRQALEAPKVDADLLLGAAEIIAALIRGGPAEGIDDYPDSKPVVKAIVRHAGSAKVALPLLAALSVIAEFAGDAARDKPADWGPEDTADIQRAAKALLDTASARDAVAAGLVAEADADFWLAQELATTLGIDAWPATFARQERGGSYWYLLLRSRSPDRFEQVLALARRRLDLARIGSGPEKGYGLGPEFVDDQAVEFILQELDRFPDKGWDFIEIGLRGRTVRARNMAVRRLFERDRGAWPREAVGWVKGAVEREPDPELKVRLQALLPH